MTIQFYANGSGRVAIYTGDDSTAIEANPFADISRVLFHSDLPYVAVTDIVTGSVNLASASYDANGLKTINLFAHGKSYTPMVLGAITNWRGYVPDIPNNQLDWSATEVSVPFSGTVQCMEGPPLSERSEQYSNVQLGVNSTHVFIHDRASAFNVDYTWTVLSDPQGAEVTIDYTVFVTDYALAGTAPPDNAGTHFEMSPTKLVIGGRDYAKYGMLRLGSSGTVLRMTQNRTLKSRSERMGGDQAGQTYWENVTYGVDGRVCWPGALNNQGLQNAGDAQDIANSIVTSELISA